MVTQSGETGTTVDFVNGRDISLNKFCFRGTTFGILAYQATGATIPASVRDALLNGVVNQKLSDLETQASSQGMPINYAKISWNEGQQGTGYFVTDLAIGIVVTPSTYINVGPKFLIDALKTVPWFKQLFSYMPLPWKAWELIPETQPSSKVPFYRWNDDSKFSPFFRSAPITQPLPDPPTEAEMLAEFTSSGNIEAVIGAFSKKMLDSGYTVTLLGYRVDVALEKSPVFRYPYTYGYQCTPHSRITVEYTTNPALPEQNPLASTRALIPAFVWVAIAFGILIISIWAGRGINQFFNNMSKETEVHETITEYYDENGNLVRKVINRDTKEGPPDWWGYVIPIVAIGGMLIVAAFLLPLRPRRSEK